MFDNFDTSDARGWRVFGSQAKVVDGKYVVIGEPIVVTLAGSETWQDYSMQAKVKVVSGKGDFGTLVRAKDDTHLYQLQYDRGDLRLVRYDGGSSWTKLSSSPYKIEPGVWYDFRMDVRGTTIICYINGAQVASVEDGFYLQGKVGFRSNETQIFVDDVEVVPLP
jgi:hypothetical protein